MPLVFIHGVNVREGNKPKEKKQFRESIDARDGLFRTISMTNIVRPPAKLHIENPYWGGHAAKFNYDLISVPTTSVETFGSMDDMMAQVLTETIPLDIAMKTNKNPGSETILLLTLARDHSLALAIDAIIAAATVSGVADDAARKNKELAMFAAKAVALAASDPDTSWLEAKHPVTGEPRLKNDSAFLEELYKRVLAKEGQAEIETFGGKSVLKRLKNSAQGMANVARRTFKVVVGGIIGAGLGTVAGGGPEVVVRTLRPKATQRAGIFLGDVFTYISKRGTSDKPGAIVRIVTEALDKALKKRTVHDEKLIIVAHSMGGNIIYDILTHYRSDIKVDLLVTIGSQVALFKELRLYMEDASSDPDTPRPERVKKPESVVTWLNIFDPVDFLGFATEGVFEGVKDYAFSNHVGPLDAHSLYFSRPMFHERLRARMAEVGFGVIA